MMRTSPNFQLLASNFSKRLRGREAGRLRPRQFAGAIDFGAENKGRIYVIRRI